MKRRWGGSRSQGSVICLDAESEEMPSDRPRRPRPRDEETLNASFEIRRSSWRTSAGRCVCYTNAVQHGVDRIHTPASVWDYSSPRIYPLPG